MIINVDMRPAFARIRSAANGGRRNYVVNEQGEELPRGSRGMFGHDALDLTGKVKASLHNARGEANGVLLDDGSQVLLSPPEAKRLAETLAVGKTVTVKGVGSASLLGKVAIARQIGPDAAHLIDVRGPHAMMGEQRGIEHRGMMDGHHGMVPIHPPTVTPQ